MVTRFDGTKATPKFLQAIAYEVYVKNVTFGLLHQWLTDMGMTVSKNTLRNWLKKGKKYLDELVCVLKSIALEKDSIVNCDETWITIRSATFRFWSTRLGKQPFSSMRMVLAAVRYLQTFWVMQN